MAFETDDYDEFAMLGDNAAEARLPLTAPPRVTRTSFTVADGQTVSAIAWGDAEPELVLLHGGGQNAHTWDTVALALGRPLLAVDLPGHGHSGRRQDRDYGPWRNAEAVASVIEQAAPAARGVVGMSLGGSTVIRLAATRPDLVRRALIVDVTPNSGVRSRALASADRGAVALVSGPPVYESFEAMAAAAVAASPGRPRSAVERGVRHNARRPSATIPGCGRTCPRSPCRSCWYSAATRRSPASRTSPNSAVGCPPPGSRSCLAPATRSRVTSRSDWPS